MLQVGVALSIYTTVTRLLNAPLLSVTTTAVAGALGRTEGKRGSPNHPNVVCCLRGPCGNAIATCPKWVYAPLPPCAYTPVIWVKHTCSWGCGGGRDRASGDDSAAGRAPGGRHRGAGFDSCNDS